MFKKRIPQTGGESILGRRAILQLRDKIIKQYCIESEYSDLILGRRKKNDLKIFSTKFEGNNGERGILYRIRFEDKSNFSFENDLNQHNGNNLRSVTDLQSEASNPEGLDIKKSTYKLNLLNLNKLPNVLPWIFELGIDKLFPTLQLLWIHSDLFNIPKLIILKDVKSYIFNGADLMVGGVIFKETKNIKDIKKNQIWVINCIDEIYPIGIGISLVDWDEISNSNNKKGKILKVIHHCKDVLSQEGDFNFNIQEECIKDIESSIDTIKLNETPLKSDTNKILKDIEMKIETYDFFLETLLFQILIDLSSDKSILPIDSSIIWDKMLRLSIKTYEIHIDIKKSSYLKFSKFIQFYNKKNLFTIKQSRNGVINIVDFNMDEISKQHKDNINNESLLPNLKKKNKNKMINNDLNEYNQIEVIILYQPNSIFQIIIDYYISNNKLENFGNTFPVKTSKGEKDQLFISINDAKMAMEFYINSNNLKVYHPDSNQNDKLRYVKLDSLLEQLYMNNKSNSDHPNSNIISISHIFKEIPNFLKIFHYIKNKSNINKDRPKILKGNCKSIVIYSEARIGARKYVTIISPYINHFNLDPYQIAESCQKKFACSATVSQIKGFPINDNIGIIIQGNITKQIPDFLNSKWGIPKSYIEIR